MNLIYFLATSAILLTSNVNAQSERSLKSKTFKGFMNNHINYRASCLLLVSAMVR